MPKLDRIEDAVIDVDGGHEPDPTQARMTLLLVGDFAETFELYLADPEMTDVMFGIGLDTARSLHEQLGGVLAR